MAKTIMMQGTSSHVGKSILAAALCRILHQDGYRVAPFKAQNMALNSYVTKDGGEMGRAQVVQAEAACLSPTVDMNPVLLKPTGNATSQIIVMGKPIGNMVAHEYHKGGSRKLFGIVSDALSRLQEQFEMIVIEGAGSPAEINLKENDIVNMRVAKHLAAPVLLIADIDRGGAFASIVGTLELLPQDERDLVKGFIINKFRGDVTLLQPAIDFLEKKTGKPVLGVIPYMDAMGIDDEDSVSLDDKQSTVGKDLRVAVIRYPKISNYTDFDCLESEEDVSLSYVSTPKAVGDADLILLPGSKNTIEDRLFLKEFGLEDAILAAVRRGVPVIGICGGYQMLGDEIADPYHTESSFDCVEGLHLLPMKTVFSKQKHTSQVIADCDALYFIGETIAAHALRGYEIHMGETTVTDAAQVQPLRIRERAGEVCDIPEGVCRADGRVFGTYIHGIFDHDGFRRSILNALRKQKGLPPRTNTRNLYREKQENYDRLAAVVRAHMDMEKIYEIMGE